MTAKSTLLVAGAVLVAATNINVAANGPTGSVLKFTPVAHTSPTSAPEMFQAYCAGCHGPDGRGNGAVTRALQTPPPDLTRLATSHGGRFPQLEVLAAIDGHPNLAERSEMPAWSRVFQSLGGNAEALLRAHLLTDYIESLQRK